MKKPKLICAGNWKLNKGPAETKAFFAEFQNTTSSLNLKDFAVFPSALSLFCVHERLVEQGLNWGGQNIYWEDNGAFTGENSAKVLSEIGATHCLVGHSERRTLFNETNEQTNKKMLSLLNNKITPVLCVGETLDERKANSTNKVIATQLKEALKNWPKGKIFWLAYEPVWAIGTGEVATPKQAEAAHLALRSELEEIIPNIASRIPILYGCSVKPNNAFDLAKNQNIDGFLVGGASLEAESFIEIYKQGMSAKEQL